MSDESTPPPPPPSPEESAHTPFEPPPAVQGINKLALGETMASYKPPKAELPPPPPPKKEK